MVVHEHVAFWENWIGLRFEQSGACEVDDALVPLEIDLERQIGRSEEPNVWDSCAAGTA